MTLLHIVLSFRRRGQLRSQKAGSIYVYVYGFHSQDASRYTRSMAKPLSNRMRIPIYIVTALMAKASVAFFCVARSVLCPFTFRMRANRELFIPSTVF